VSRRAALVATISIVVLAAAIELGMGRIPYCKCGYVKVWHGVVLSSENSQHLSDWYTPSHVIHGIAFYAILWLVARRWPVRARFVMAVALEAAWEVLENTPMVINRYREATMALSLGLTVAMEVFVGFMIRDNLTLNIVMLVYPVEAIKRWQGG
jgi:hypothetical protein